MNKRLLAVCAATALISTVPGVAAGSARQQEAGAESRNTVADVTVGQHGTTEGHLPAGQSNMALISKLGLTDVEVGITDVDELKGFAYLGTDCGEVSEEGGAGRLGVHVVDVRRPRSPKRVAFIRTGARVSEGIHAFRAKTPRFDGELLVLSRETCENLVGGISVVDVSNPQQPRVLVKQFGDTDANDPEDPTPLEVPNDTHSVMGWSTNGKAYAATIDNWETGFLDVDIFDLTNPSRPRMISETGVDEWPELEGAPMGGFATTNSHDLQVKKIDGTWYMMVSYWDAGWVLLNVDDPANPQYVTDSSYAAEDPEMPGFTPEGNAHQGMWSANNEFWIGTDEDIFNTYRIQPFRILTGPNAGDYISNEFSWTVPIVDEYEDSEVNGPTIYVGTACPAVADNPATPEDESEGTGTASQIPDASTLNAGPGEQKIAVVLRGTCFFSEKIEQVELKGYDVAIVANHHAGSGAGEDPDVTLCGSLGHEYTPTINAICIGHRAFHLLFNQTPTFDGADEPSIGTRGEKISATSVFDGWGYVHLLDADTLESIDTYAVEEAKQEAFASGFGTLSVHEVETDKRRSKNLAYLSYYSAGARVLKFGQDGMTEQGFFIDEGGSDFWGVETIKRGKRRPLLLFSDRSRGLYILKYTGPQ